MSRRWAIAAAALALAACKGQISTTGGAGPSSPAQATGTAGTSGSLPMGAGGGAPSNTLPMGSTTPLCAADQSGQPAYRMLRRVSEAEYNAGLIDIFGADPTTWQNIQFVGDIRQAGAYSTYSAALTVNQAWLASLVDATFDRAQSLLSGPQAATIMVAPCTATAIDANCATAMVKAYGYRLFRRPLADSEVSDYVGLFTQATTLMLSPSDALAGTLSALMQSPNALYIQELGQAAGTGYKLTGYELASILAFGLTGSTPSKALLDSAGSGGLDTPAGISAASQALIASPAGQAHMSKFFVEWLAYDGAPYAAKDPTVYNLPNTVATAMVTETQTLVDGLYKNGGSLSDLLLSPSTSVNLSLAQFYGWPTAGLTDTAFTTVQRPTGQGLGLLAQGGMLTRLATPNSSSPTQRGLFVLRSLICKDVPPPPADVPVIPVPSGTVTTRQRYETQHAVGSCGVCHTHIDDIGFGLENFDGVGVYRTMEVGQPIDASGYILDLGDVTFNGPEDLAQKLAAAPEVSQCLAAQMTAYVLGVSVGEALCIAPQASYAQGQTPLSLANVLTQVVEPNHLAQRSP
jgi:hypothetical protein